MTHTPRHVLAFAHRGGAHDPAVEGLENTLAAFQHAVDLGYRYLETDVHLTKDGVLIAFHDDVLDRVTDGTGRVADLSLSRIRKASIGGREPIPTLGELFDAFDDPDRPVTINIDLKGDGTPTALAAFLDLYEAHSRVIVGSFSVQRLEEFRRLTGGRVRTSANPGEVAAYVLSPSARLARLVAADAFVAFQVPSTRTVTVAGHRRTIRVVTPGFVRRAHANGKQVHVWTIDDPAEMKALIDLGVDGIITDRTDLLRDVLREAGLWDDQ